LNGIPAEDRAYLEHSDVEKPALDKFAAALSDLTAVDLMRPDKGARAVVRDLFSLPEEQDEMADEEEDDVVDDSADVLADELISEGDAEPETPTVKGNVNVPEDVRSTVREFLSTWKTWPTESRINSVVMMTRAKRLERGAVSKSMAASIKQFFATTKVFPLPGGAPFSAPRQYWDANGGDAGKRWTEGL
jgi:hypothetical protein